jgi:hypothetical protein
LAEGVGAELRAYPLPTGGRTLLGSTVDSGDCERDDPISTSGGYAPPRGLLVVGRIKGASMRMWVKRMFISDRSARTRYGCSSTPLIRVID